MELKLTQRTAGRTTSTHEAVRIERVRLEQLFGLYTYAIPGDSGALSRLALLYGENGLGKTNILRILFHLLSPAGDRGHRTALGKIKFRRIEVALTNRIVVSAARRDSSLEGETRFEVSRSHEGTAELVAAWDWFPDEMTVREAQQRRLIEMNPEVAKLVLKERTAEASPKAIQAALFKLLAKEADPKIGQGAFLKALEENVPQVYFLNSDRGLASDRLQRGPTYSERETNLRPEAMMAKGRERALDEAVSLASRELSRLGLVATRQGSRSMHGIYYDLIRRLAHRATKKKQRQQKRSATLVDLKKQVLELSERYDLFAQYGLAPQLRGPSLVGLLDAVRTTDRSVAADVLRPYVESLTESSKSIGEAYLVIDKVVTTLNGFLHDKSIAFTVADGLTVRNKLGSPLQPKDLSSGEQQLLLVFCHIVLAHGSGGIFIIDEPEISLNIKWQRRLVNALMDLDPVGNLQFILASHSMEILAGHPESVVALMEAGE